MLVLMPQNVQSNEPATEAHANAVAVGMLRSNPIFRNKIVFSDTNLCRYIGEKLYNLNLKYVFYINVIDFLINQLKNR